MFDLRQELVKVVAEVLHDMLQEVLEGIRQETLFRKVYQQLTEELRREDFLRDIEHELLNLLEEKNMA